MQKETAPMLPAFRKDGLGRRLRKDFQRNKYVYLLLLIVVAYYVLFKLKPMTYMVIAFQDYKPFKGIQGSKFIGFKNFITFFNSRDFVRLLRNTLLLSFYSMLIEFPMPIVFALMINEVRCTQVKRVMQTISYMPHFISMVVICGLLRNFVSSDGIINSLIRFVNPNWASVNLLGDPKFYRAIHIGSGLWQKVGWDSILYLATLSTIDPQLYEAAYIDGASRMQRIYHITLPGLRPVITVQFLMSIGFIMSGGGGYEKNLLLYSPAIYETADVIGTYVYRYTFMNTNYGLGAAVGVFNTLANIIVLMVANGLCRAISEDSLW